MAEYIDKALLVDEIEWDNDIEKWTIYPDELDSIPTINIIPFSEEQVRDMWKAVKMTIKRLEELKQDG